MQKNIRIIAGLGFAILISMGILCAVYSPYYLLVGERQNNSVTMIDIAIPSGNISSDRMGSSGIVRIHAVEPATPASLPVYKTVLNDGDVVSLEFEDLFKARKNVISQQDAPEIARKALEPYGGLPKDAVLRLSETVYGNSINSTTWTIESSTPIYTQVYYNRVVDEMPVIGYSDKIRVCLGENGKVLKILKIWRTLEKTDNKMAIIPARSATGKLLNGDVLDRPKNVGDVSVNSIRLKYYETSRTEKEILLEPVWAFDGNTSSGSPEEFLVYARQFANFSQAPKEITKSVAGKSMQENEPLTVTFTDTSDARPTKWLWDFGDGTTSTGQNPVHTFKSAGTYDVTLTAWNDVGSDTRVQQCIVTGEPVQKTPETIIPVNTTPVTGTNLTIIPVMNNVTGLPTVSATSMPNATATIVVANETANPSATTSPVPANIVPAITANETAASPVPTAAVPVSPLPTTLLNATVNAA